MSNLMLNLDFSGGGNEPKKKKKKSGPRRLYKNSRIQDQKKHRHGRGRQQPPPLLNARPAPLPLLNARMPPLPLLNARPPPLPHPNAARNTASSLMPGPAPARSVTPKPGSSGGSTSLTITVKNASSRKQPKTSTSALVPGTLCQPLKYLAMDCEMVGTGPKGRNSELARCSIVSYDGDVIYDKYIKPGNPVTDYRTRWSGIGWKELAHATRFKDAMREILKLLQGKVVVGHSLHNDFKVMSYTHPAVLTRDTSRIPLLNVKAGFKETECVSLKRLTKALFNRDIQTGKRGHSSVEDAQATMELYKVVEVEWERTLLAKSMW